MVSWQTDPGPEDLKGYRLEKRHDGGDWLDLVAETKETRYHDTKGKPGDLYRLFAVNGLGDEFYLGENGGESPPSLPGGLMAYPIPYRDGELTIAFATGSVGGAPLNTEVAIFDVLGRKVRTVANGRYADAVGRATWDGRDERGERVASGVYFIRATTGLSSHTRKLVIVK